MNSFLYRFGWYGFNPGSVLTIDTANRGEVAALATVNTTLCACMGAVSAMFTSTLLDYYYYGYHTYDLCYTMNGCLTGLVAITGGCAAVETWAAVLIGIGAGWAYLLGSKLMIRFKIDDAVDAVPVHMFGGAWGVLATGLFTTPAGKLAAYNLDSHPGWFYDGSDFTLCGIQLLGILFIFAWGSVVMGSYFYALNYMGWLRIDALEEEVGMDISRHKGAAYDLTTGVANEEDVKQLENARSSITEDRSNRGSKKLATDAGDVEKVVDDTNDIEAEA
jgi:ammonium transporter, Amt family